MKFISFFIVFFGLINFGYAKELSADNYIKKSIKKYEKKSNKWLEKRSNKLKTINRGVPLIKNVELRYSLDWYDDQQHDIKTRIKFKSLKENLAYKSYLSSKLGYLDFKKEIEKNEKLKDVYENILQNMLLNENYNYLSQKIELINSLIKISNIDDSLNYELLIKSKKSEIENRLNLMEVEKRLKKNSKKISKQDSVESIKITFKNLIKVDQIIESVKKLNGVSFDSIKSVQFLRLKNSNKIAKLKLKKASINPLISYVDIGWNRKFMDGIRVNITPYSENFYYGIGVNLPFDFSGKYSQIEEDIEKYNDDKGVENYKKKLQKDYNAKLEKFNLLVGKYRYLNSKDVWDVYNTQLKIYQSMPNSSPVVIIKTKQEILSLKHRVSKTYFDILELYIKMLYIKSQLDKRSNWLEI